MSPADIEVTAKEAEHPQQRLSRDEAIRLVMRSRKKSFILHLKMEMRAKDQGDVADNSYRYFSYSETIKVSQKQAADFLRKISDRLDEKAYVTVVVYPNIIFIG
jgi:hypothetical protein